MKMNNKGFSLVELVLVVVLMAVISVLVIPEIMDSLDASKEEKYKSVEKIIIKNLKYYNEKYEVDLWSNIEGDGCIKVPYSEMVMFSGSDIDLDDCIVGDYLYVQRSGNKYSYYTSLTCNNGDYQVQDPGLTGCSQPSI